MYDFVLHRHGDEDLADEIASLVVMRLWFKRGHRDPASLAWRYIAVSAINMIRNHWRSESRESHRRARAELPSHSTPEGEPLEWECWRRFDETVAGLPQRAREALLAVDIHGVAIDDLAESWGVTRKAVEMRLAHARRAVRAEFGTPPGRSRRRRSD